jgi:hypothetical protein
LQADRDFCGGLFDVGTRRLKIENFTLQVASSTLGILRSALPAESAEEYLRSSDS